MSDDRLQQHIEIPAEVYKKNQAYQSVKEKAQKVFEQLKDIKGKPRYLPKEGIVFMDENSEEVILSKDNNSLLHGLNADIECARIFSELLTDDYISNAINAAYTNIQEVR